MTTFPQIFVFDIIVRSVESILSILEVLNSPEAQWSTGVKPELGKAEGLGKKLVPTLSLKIPTQSGFAAIEASEMLSSMNFVVRSTSVISSNGLTGIRLLWKSKEARSAGKRKRSGLRLTSTQVNGIPISMRHLLQPFIEELTSSTSSESE